MCVLVREKVLVAITAVMCNAEVDPFEVSAVHGKFWVSTPYLVRIDIESGMVKRKSHNMCHSLTLLQCEKKKGVIS